MLLSVVEARLHITTSLGDPALQTRLDAAESVITDALGPVGAVTEIVSSGSGDLVMLSRRPAAITSVNERDVVLNANDYAIVGRLLRRLDTGANPDSWWRGRLYITYTVADDLARRKIAQAQLVELDVESQSSSTTERIGDWSETVADAAEVATRRAEILAALTTTLVIY